MDTPHPPSVRDLQTLVDFIDARLTDEARKQGALGFFLGNGVIFKPDITRARPGIDTIRAHAVAQHWLDDHTPDRFFATVTALASVSRGLLDTALYGRPGAHHLHGMWRHLTSAARLWASHPDFLSVWNGPDGT